MSARRDMTIPQLAEELGVSRVAVWKRVKAGEIPAHKIGAQYVVAAKDAEIILGRSLTEAHRKRIRHAVGRVVKEYGPVLKRLSRE